MVQDSLLNEETRRKGSNNVIFSSKNEALVMESRERNMYIKSHKFSIRDIMIILKDLMIVISKGGVYQCGGRDSTLRGRLLGIKV